MKEKDLTLWKQNGCYAQSAEIKQGYRYGKIQNWKTFPYIVRNANRKHWLKQKNYKSLLSKSQTHKTQSRWTSEYVISQFVGSFLVGYKFVKQTPTIIKKRCFGGRYCYARKDLTDTLQTCFKVWRDFFMFFFRAVIYLLMQRRFDLYIAYRGMAGSQLKKSLPMQRYFSPWNQK